MIQSTLLSSKIDIIRGEYRQLGPLEPFYDKHIFFFRQAESIADVFPDWIQRCELDTPFYVPFDLNMPISVPRRRAMTAAYDVDPPISEIGKICTQMLARDLAVRCGSPIDAIYTSPSLICLQTANEIEHYLAKRCGPIRINADLCVNRRGADYWLPKHQLLDLGYNIDDKYEPFVTMDSTMTLESMQTILKTFVKDIIKLNTNVIVVADSLAMKCIYDEANCILRPPKDLQSAYEEAEKCFGPGSTFTLKVSQYMNEILLEPSPVTIRPITAIGMSTTQNKEPDMAFL